MSINRNIWSTDSYIYMATASGVAIYDTDTEALVDLATISGGANSVWANDQYLYAATNMGLYRSSVSGTISLSPYKVEPDITSNIVYYVHGNSDYVCVTTLSGVDRYTVSTSARTFDTISDTYKCFQTSNGDYYYITNAFQTISGLEMNVFEWNYFRTITLDHPAISDNFEVYFEIPLTQPDEIYRDAATDGADIRVLSLDGQVLPHYIEVWCSGTPPKIWVSVPVGTESFYVLYGNDHVSSTSDRDLVFKLYDDFSGSSLDTTKWMYDPGTYNPYHSATVANEELTLRGVGDLVFNFFSVDTFGECLIEASVKWQQYNQSYPNGLNFNIGMYGGLRAYIGQYTSENTHRLINSSAGSDIVGTKRLSSSYKDYSMVRTSYYQESTYDGETLSISGTLGISNVKFYVSIQNGTYDPTAVFDYIMIRSYDPTPQSCTVSNGSAINNMSQFGRVHSAYEGGGGFTYTAGKNLYIETEFVNDIHVTEGTSNYGNDNVIFLGTSCGGLIIEEKRGDEANLRKRIYLLET